LKIDLFYSSFDQLLLINNAPLRKLLTTWVKEPILNLHDLEELVCFHAPYLLPIITSQQCESQYRWIVKQISKSSPASALIPCDALQVVKKVLQPDYVPATGKFSTIEDLACLDKLLVHEELPA